MADVMHQDYWYKMGREGQKIPLICCDCGLTHEFEVMVDDNGEIHMKVHVDKRTTARIRRRGDAELFGKSTEYKIVSVKKCKKEGE